MTKAKKMGYPINIECTKMFDKNWREELLDYATSNGMDISEIKYTQTASHVRNNSGVKKKGGKCGNKATYIIR